MRRSVANVDPTLLPLLRRSSIHPSSLPSNSRAHRSSFAVTKRQFSRRREISTIELLSRRSLFAVRGAPRAAKRRAHQVLVGAPRRGDLGRPLTQPFDRWSTLAICSELSDGHRAVQIAVPRSRSCRKLSRAHFSLHDARDAVAGALATSAAADERVGASRAGTGARRERQGRKVAAGRPQRAGRRSVDRTITAVCVLARSDVARRSRTWAIGLHLAPT